MIEKANEETWKDCTNFLPEDFEKLLKSLRADSTNRVLWCASHWKQRSF